MDFGKRVIVGIKGTKGSGKDTIASMIHYIMAVGVTAANMDGWENYIKTPDGELYVPTLHFADKIKDDLSIAFGINRECFDDAKYKDEMYYHFRTGAFIEKIDSLIPIKELTLDDLCMNTLAEWRSQNNDECIIKLRTLMQYYGTDIMRNHIGVDVWIRSTINKAIQYRDYYGYAVIGDVRYDNENNAIYNIGGKIIYVNRFGNAAPKEHSSEVISTNMKDNVIINNGTKLGLFYKVLEFVRKEIV